MIEVESKSGKESKVTVTVRPNMPSIIIYDERRVIKEVRFLDCLA